MNLDNPFAVFAVCLLAQSLAAYFGALAGRKWRRMTADDHQDFDIVRAATLDAARTPDRIHLLDGGHAL